ncbi:hypothetical protein RRG08_032862 [Elysia crispata]|uniref:Uncharacterized protein n=1 Tax=Elysia crispata TaxID=231223 RepID=A0AAE0ZKI1_9GAST|nr:hypothetical protein RRG08_032862 [Elysia crispata]
MYYSPCGGWRLVVETSCITLPVEGGGNSWRPHVLLSLWRVAANRGDLMYYSPCGGWRLIVETSCITLPVEGGG